jgi:hypothetical protein
MRKQPNQIKVISSKKFLACNDAHTLGSRLQIKRGSLGDYVLAGDLPREYSQNTLDNTSVIFVPFLDEKNNLVRQIYAGLTTSPTNAAIIDKKNKMVVGDGFSVAPKQGLVLRNTEPITDEQLQNIDTFLTDFSPFGTTAIDELRKVASDYNTYGNAYVEVIKTTVGGVKKYYQQHKQFEYGRLKKMEEGETQPTHVGFSRKWEQSSQQPIDLVVYPLYPNFEQIAGDKAGNERSIIHIKQYYPGFQYYGMPAYVAGLLHAELEYRIAKFNQSSFDNGFMPSAFIQMFGAANDEEANAAVLAMNEKYTGTGNNAKLITQVIANKEDAANVHILDSSKEGSWTELGQIARENIITAHQWSPALAGLMTAGSLGSNQQIRAEFEIVQNTVIRPIQSVMLGQWLNRTMRDAAEFLTIDFGKSELVLLNNSPLSFMTDISIAEFMTKDEVREEFGLKPIEDDELETPNDTPDGNDFN